MRIPGSPGGSPVVREQRLSDAATKGVDLALAVMFLEIAIQRRAGRSAAQSSRHAGHVQHQLVDRDQAFGAVGLDGGGKRGVGFAGIELPGHAPVHQPHRLEARIHFRQ